MVVCFVGADSIRSTQLLRSLGGVIACQRFGSCDSLRAYLVRGNADCILVEPWDALGHSTAPFVRSLRETLPLVPIIAICRLDVRACGELLSLGRSGVDEVIFEGFDSTSGVIEKTMERARARAFMTATIDHVVDSVPREARSFIRFVFEHALEKLTVNLAASELDVHRNTLARRLSRLGLPPAEEIIPRVRLLIASQLLESTKRSVESIAALMHFGSASNLRNAFRRHFGMRPSDVATIGSRGVRDRLIEYLTLPSHARSSYDTQWRSRVPSDVDVSATKAS